MKILVAPNAFKGSLNAYEVAEKIAEGLQMVDPEIESILCPIADGGEGTVEIFVETGGGTYHTCEVSNAIGEPVEARYGILADRRTAVLELAEASGLGQLPPSKLAPMKASTFGTGQLMLDALDKGCKRIILGLGGSATTDGGTGILQALGVKFLNESGYQVPPGGGGLGFLDNIDISGLDPRIADCEIILPCDVSNPLLGEKGCAAVFSPQKGATKEQMNLLEENLSHFAQLTKQKLGKEIGDMPFGGAAGGTSAGLSAFLDAKLIGGIDFMLHQIGFESKLREAQYLITAEGRLDSQSLDGKGPYGVARRAKVRNVPAFCITGQLPEDFDPKQFDVFQSIFPIPTRPMSLETAMAQGGELVRFAAWQIGSMLKVAQNLLN
jgi:glycerate kinase